jgi:hypothetical protein
VWFIVGAAVLLWTPRIADHLGKPKEQLGRLEYDELASQWEDVVADPVKEIWVELQFPQATVRARDFETLLTGTTLTFESDGVGMKDAPTSIQFRSNNDSSDLQKSLSLVIVDDAGRTAPTQTLTEFWRQFEGSDTWLCWWSTKFAWRNKDDFACSLQVSARFPSPSPLSLRTLFSFSGITIRSPYGIEVVYRGPETMPDPSIQVTFTTQRGAFRLPVEVFRAGTEVSDDTGNKTIVESISGHGLRQAMRDRFFKSGGLRSTDQGVQRSEVHTATATVTYLSGFFPRKPTPAEWDKMRHIHPDLVPENH